MNAKAMAIKNEELDDDEIKDVEIELEAKEGDEDEVNPNVADQLTNLPEGDVEQELSPKDKYQALLKEHPEVKELYGDDVKKRIGKLTYDWKEEGRQKDEAIKFAQKVQEENKKLKSKQTDQDDAFLNEHTTRLDAQLKTAKKQYEEAYGANDAEAMAEANANIGLAASQLGQAQQTSARFKRAKEANPVTEIVDTPYQPTPAKPAEDTPTIDPKAQAWAEKNKWFGDDQELSNAALNIHNQLVRNEGYLPQSDAYYSTLDERLLKNFPESTKLKGKAVELNPGQQAVAPVNGQSNSKPKGKTVKLTASQVKVARALGVPLAEYAKYVV